MSARGPLFGDALGRRQAQPDQDHAGPRRCSIFTTLQPIMFVLLFAYVFGGAIHVAGRAAYREFLMAGIFAQTVTFGATFTGAGLADDMQKGIIDRFRSLPMAPSARC